MHKMLLAFFGIVLPTLALAQIINTGGEPKSDATHDGYLSSGDWVTFNASSGCGGAPCVPPTRSIATTAPLTGGGDLSTNRTFAIPSATSLVDGYLNHTDWGVFNGKAASGANADITSLSHVAKLYPASNGTTAVQVTKADGTTQVTSWDTTNSRFGVGPNAPSYQLSVDGGNLDAGSGNGVLELKNNPVNYGPEIRFNNVASGKTYLFVNGATNDTVGAGNFGIQDGGTPRLVILSNGNTGMGSNTPGSKLTVAGEVESTTTGFKFPNAVTISGAADASHNGYLASGDWSTFNSKQTATLAANNALAGNASNVATAFNSTLLGDIQASTKQQTATVTIAAPGLVTATAHGLALGDKVYFTTTGALPTGLAASTTYYVNPGDADHFWVYTTYAAATGSGSAITTTGTQSGVHTLYTGGLKFHNVSALPPSGTVSMLGGNNGKVLSFLFDDALMASVDQSLIYPGPAPTVGQFLQVSAINPPLFNLQWANPTGGLWISPVKCVAAVQDYSDLTNGIADCHGGFSPNPGERMLAASVPGHPEAEGIYTLSDDGFFLNRSPDASTAAQFQAGMAVQSANAFNGDTEGGSAWIQTAFINALDTDAQHWQRLTPSSATQSSGSCTVSSTTISTTPSNVTCSGVPAAAGISVTCSGAAAFSTAAGDALYARATGTANQLALNTVVANLTAMTFACSWVQP